MIQANELRIGNWVFDEEFKEPIAISHVDYIMDGFTPIPLTPEILEKAGFKFTPICHNDFHLKGLWYIGELELEENIVSAFCFNYGDNGFITIQYVHQLQNLYFALTGEELQIEL